MILVMIDSSKGHPKLDDVEDTYSISMYLPPDSLLITKGKSNIVPGKA